MCDDGVPDPHFVNHVLNNNLTENFALLRGAPGICLEPKSWGAIKELIDENTEESLAKLGRHPSGIVSYRKYRKQILAEYASMGDFVSAQIMGHPVEMDEGGKKISSKDRPAASIKPIWRDNDFPYNFSEGIEHHNLWSEKPLTGELLSKEIERHRAGWEFMYFVNPPALASIPAVWHAHIVSRKIR